MAKRHSSSVKRKNAFFLEWDTTNWLKQFDKTVEDFKGSGGAFERAVDRMIPLIEQEFRTFMAGHTLTTNTIDSLMSKANLYWGDVEKFKSVGTTTKGKKGFTGHETKAVGKENILFVEYGFTIEKDDNGKGGGIAAVFLDVGRPGVKYKNGTVSKEMKPTFFIYYALERNMATFNKIFREEVMKELGGIL